MAYRFFVTDELFYLNNNVVNMSGGARMQTRFYDILNPQREKEERTADEIIEHIKNKIRSV